MIVEGPTTMDFAGVTIGIGSVDAPAGVTFLTAQSSTSNIGDVFFIAGVLAVLIVAGVAIVFVLRKIYSPGNSSDRARGGSGFTLAELRDLHKRGELSDEQYAAARDAIVSGHTTKTNEIAATRRARGSALPKSEDQSAGSG